MRQWQLICQSTLDKCVLIANGEIKKSRVKLLREGFKKNVKLGLLAEVMGGGVIMGFRGPTCYQVSFLMLENGLKMLENYDIT